MIALLSTQISMITFIRICAAISNLSKNSSLNSKLTLDFTYKSACSVLEIGKPCSHLCNLNIIYILLKIDSFFAEHYGKGFSFIIYNDFISLAVNIGKIERRITSIVWL